MQIWTHKTLLMWEKFLSPDHKKCNDSAKEEYQKQVLCTLFRASATLTQIHMEYFQQQETNKKILLWLFSSLILCSSLIYLSSEVLLISVSTVTRLARALGRVRSTADIHINSRILTFKLALNEGNLKQ